MTRLHHRLTCPGHAPRPWRQEGRWMCRRRREWRGYRQPLVWIAVSCVIALIGVVS